MVELVTTHGTRKWSYIGAQLEGRNGKQCRERCVRARARGARVRACTRGRVGRAREGVRMRACVGRGRVAAARAVCMRGV